MPDPTCTCNGHEGRPGHFNDCPVMTSTPEFQLAAELKRLQDRADAFSRRAGAMIFNARIELKQVARERIDKL